MSMQRFSSSFSSSLFFAFKTGGGICDLVNGEHRGREGSGREGLDST